MNTNQLTVSLEVAEAALAAQGLGGLVSHREVGRARVHATGERGSVVVEVAGRDRVRIRGVRGSIGFAGSEPTNADFSCERYGNPGAAVAVRVMRRLAWGWRAMMVSAPGGRLGVYANGKFAAMPLAANDEA